MALSHVADVRIRCRCDTTWIRQKLVLTYVISLQFEYLRSPVEHPIERGLDGGWVSGWPAA